MQCKIHITGQISGNVKLVNAISTIDSTMTKGMFYSYFLTFPTKKDAYNALWSAYKNMRNDGYTTLRYNKKSSLSYDASTAKIITD